MAVHSALSDCWVLRPKRTFMLPPLRLGKPCRRKGQKECKEPEDRERAAEALSSVHDGITGATAARTGPAQDWACQQSVMRNYSLLGSYWLLMDAGVGSSHCLQLLVSPPGSSGKFPSIITCNALVKLSGSQNKTKRQNFRKGLTKIGGWPWWRWEREKMESECNQNTLYTYMKR